MIIVNITIMIAPEFLEHQFAEERRYQWAKSYQAEQTAKQRATLEAYHQSHPIQAVCELCGVEVGWYQTPGKAKMALSGHQKSCRRQR